MIATLSAFAILISTIMNEVPPMPVSRATTVLASHEFSLVTRYPDYWVNEVFKDNILLTLAYMRQGSRLNKPIDWEDVQAPGRFSLTLEKGEVFAFHDLIATKYANKPLVTTNAHFNFTDGFRSSGYLYGDGVCHLASLMYWVARDAGLKADAPTNHNFRAIPEIPREYGVSIFTVAYEPVNSARQNLYITNTFDVPVIFIFDYDGTVLRIDVIR